jgi:hypothetical protein
VRGGLEHGLLGAEEESGAEVDESVRGGLEGGGGGEVVGCVGEGVLSRTERAYWE